MKRVMALGQPKTQAELQELVAALVDENSNLRWLAGSSLARLGEMATVQVLAAYVQTKPAEVAMVQVRKILGLIAETADDEAVRDAARELLG